MRNPVRTEAEAFEFVIAALVLFAAVAVAGILGSGWIALLVFLVLAPSSSTGTSAAIPRSGSRPCGTGIVLAPAIASGFWSSPTRRSPGGRYAGRSFSEPRTPMWTSSSSARR